MLVPSTVSRASPSARHHRRVVKSPALPSQGLCAEIARVLPHGGEATAPVLAVGHRDGLDGFQVLSLRKDLARSPCICVLSVPRYEVLCTPLAVCYLLISLEPGELLWDYSFWWSLLPDRSPLQQHTTQTPSCKVWLQQGGFPPFFARCARTYLILSPSHVATCQFPTLKGDK